jgi:hypothetical protein
MTDLQKLNDLDTRIREMYNALDVFQNHLNTRRGIGNDIKSKLRIETKKTLFVFGSRGWGVGTSITEFELPYDMVDPLEVLIHNKIEVLKAEYDKIKKQL